MAASIRSSSEYLAFVEALKERVRHAQTRAALSVNKALVLLYWQIGRDILARQAHLGWGAKVIDQLSRDLRRAFPGMKGLSARNLKYMRSFAEAWPEGQIVQQVAAQLPWFHHCVLLDKVKDPARRLWYARAAVEHGWSRARLVRQIERRAHERQGQAITNFEQALASGGSERAARMLKDPYVFDFLLLGDEVQERELEQALVHDIQSTLMELGEGFAFVGRQVPLEVAVDDRLRDAALDGPSIGLLLCRSKERVVAEYALRDMTKPMGVASILHTRLLPHDLQSALPTIESLEEELGRIAEPK